jgi:hypothetical protein
MIVFERRACAILYNLLRSLDNRRTWLIPANVCADVPATFIEADQPFLLADLDPHSLEIDLNCYLDDGDGRPLGGIVFVRAYGSEGDRTEVFAKMKAHHPGVVVVDDKCLCRPDPDGHRLTPLADLTLFSTGPAKYADLGEGGFAHVSENIPYERYPEPFDATAFAEQKLTCKKALAESIPFPGNAPGWLDLRAPEVTWEEHRAQLMSHLETIDRHKRLINAIYEELLPDEIQMHARMQNWRFNILVSEPAPLVADIVRHGLFASRHYALLTSTFGSGRFPVAEQLRARVVNLFNDLHFDEAQARRVAFLVLRHLAVR